MQKVAQKKSHAHSVKNGIGFSVLREVMDAIDLPAFFLN